MMHTNAVPFRSNGTARSGWQPVRRLLTVQRMARGVQPRAFALSNRQCTSVVMGRQASRGPDFRPPVCQTEGSSEVAKPAARGQFGRPMGARQARLLNRSADRERSRMDRGQNSRYDVHRAMPFLEKGSAHSDAASHAAGHRTWAGGSWSLPLAFFCAWTVLHVCGFPARGLTGTREHSWSSWRAPERESLGCPSVFRRG